MKTIDTQSTVGDLVREIPSRARVFEAMKIDYCCGGKVSLADACRKRKIDPAWVVDQLRQSDANAADTQSANALNADAMGLTELADHIESTHHAYLKQELPRLDWMTEKVSRVHGDKEPRLIKTREAFLALKAELEPHMMKEETILFPVVRQLDSSSNDLVFNDYCVSDPIRQMEHEHDQAGKALTVLSETTDQYTPPQWACNTDRAMLDSLAGLQSDLHQHIHKENNVLFPKTLQRHQQKHAAAT